MHLNRIKIKRKFIFHLEYSDLLPFSFLISRLAVQLFYLRFVEDYEAKVLEWVAILFSKDLPNPGIGPGLETVEQWLTLFFWTPKSLKMVIAAVKLRHLLLGRKVMTNLDSVLKSRDITFSSPSSQGYGFSSSHVWMWGLDYKESWETKNWYFWTVVL